MKIGRLGVHKDVKRKQVGTNLLELIKEIFVTNNRTGCRFLTVDSYSTIVDFYKKNDFDFLDNFDKEAETQIMYYDLIRFVVS